MKSSPSILFLSLNFILSFLMTVKLTALHWSLIFILAWTLLACSLLYSQFTNNNPDVLPIAFTIIVRVLLGQYLSLLPEETTMTM